MIDSVKPDGKAIKTRATFQLTYAVGISIQAPASKLWTILSDASGFPGWNSTIKSIKGRIAQGEKIELVATIAPERIFKLRVSEFIPQEKMVWRDGAAPMFQGTRTYILKSKNQTTTEFFMEERFSGLMLPMIAKALPDFSASFETYAADLKRVAELP